MRGRPFQAGISGNPKGRPVGSISINSSIRRRLAELDPVHKIPTVELVAQALIDQAISGNVQALKVILDRVDGPAFGIESGDLYVHVRYDKEDS